MDLIAETLRQAGKSRRIPRLCACLALFTAHALLAQNAYVTNFGGTVSVIATATNTVTATIPVGSYPYGVAVTPDGGGSIGVTATSAEGRLSPAELVAVTT